MMSMCRSEFRSLEEHPAARNTNTDGRLLIVRDGKWVNATREEFDATLIRFKCIKR